MSKVVDGVSNSNDALGTTVGSKSNGKYSPAVLSAFGENRAASEPRATNHEPRTFFTGKPMVEGLGHAFWMRNYRAGLAKWQTTDPMGYPDGWNQLAYCNNGVTSEVDFGGTASVYVTAFSRNAKLIGRMQLMPQQFHGSSRQRIGSRLKTERLTMCGNGKERSDV